MQCFILQGKKKNNSFLKYGICLKFLLAGEYLRSQRRLVHSLLPSFPELAAQKIEHHSYNLSLFIDGWVNVVVVV